MKYLIYLTVSVLIFFQSCSPGERIKGKTWEGKLYRQSDGKELSEAKLKISNDSLYLYANAVFGAGNDTLVLVHANRQDSVYTYRSMTGGEYTVSLSYTVKKTGETSAEYLYVTDVERDFYLILHPALLDIRTAGALDFYNNRTVPRESYKYLDGVYEGEFKTDDFFESLALLESGGMSFKIIFESDSELQLCIKNLITSFLSGKKEPCDRQNYHIEGDNIIINGTEVNGKILDRGERILFKFKNYTIDLFKQ